MLFPGQGWSRVKWTDAERAMGVCVPAVHTLTTRDKIHSKEFR